MGDGAGTAGGGGATGTSESGATGAGPAPVTAGTSGAADSTSSGNAGGTSGAPNTSAAAAVAEAVAEAGGANTLDLAGADGDRLVTYMLDGEQVTEPLRDAMRNVSRSKASYKRFESGAQAKKEAEAREQRLRERPHEVLRSDVASYRKIARDVLRITMDPTAPAELKQAVEAEFREALEDAGRAPEEVEHDRRKRELEQRDQELTKREKALQEEQITKQQAVYERRFVKAMTGALEKAGVPTRADGSHDPAHVQAMAEHLAHLRDLGLPVDGPGSADTFADAASDVAEAFRARRTSTVGHLRDLPPEQLATELGPEALKKIAQYQADQLRKGTPAHDAGPPTRPGGVGAAPPAAPRVQSRDDWEANMAAARSSGKLPWAR